MPGVEPQPSPRLRMSSKVSPSPQSDLPSQSPSFPATSRQTSPRQTSPDFARNFSGKRQSPALAPTSPEKPKDSRQLIEALEKHYDAELKRISPSWAFALDGPTHQPVDVAESVGVPGIVLGAILAGKCRDQRITVTAERQKRFAEWMQRHCSSIWFTLHDSGVGPECAKGVVLALALNERFTSLSLACNTLGDAGAAVVARVLPEHQALLHLDLSANDIGHAGATSVFEALLLNRSVTYLDMSSRAGSLRNHFAKHNAGPLENLLATNPVLANLALQGTCLGPEAAAGLARGLAANSTLTSLDLAADDLGPKGAAALAEALGPNCGLEELNLSDNHLGDEGLAALAWKLGALPSAPDVSAGASSDANRSKAPRSTTPRAQEGGSSSSTSYLKQPTKYIEAMAVLRRAVSDLGVTELAHLASQDESIRIKSLARMHQSLSQLSAAMEMTAPPALPRLRVLLLGGNDATHVGASRIEDALQLNNTIQRLTLDRADHMGGEFGAKSLVTSLPLNTGLRYLNLAACGLKTLGVLELAKALIFNKTLETLSLKGNRFGDEAAAALGAVLGLGGTLRTLILASCHLEDSSGMALCQGLVTNTSLESLNLRDNLLREGTGRTLADTLRRHYAMANLDLELNSIDFRFLSQVKQLLERNGRLKEKGRPDRYRRRIDELLDIQREVGVVTTTINTNVQLKMEAKANRTALLQELKDVGASEQCKQQKLDEQLEEVRKHRSIVDGEVEDVLSRMRAVCSEGEHEANMLRSRIEMVEGNICRHDKHIVHTKKSIVAYQKKADEELAKLREESETVDTQLSSASLLCAAAQRNLDSFAASLKAIEEDIAGGADPRQRIVEQARREDASGPRNGSRAPGGGRTMSAGRKRASVAAGAAGATSAAALKNASAGLASAKRTPRSQASSSAPRPRSAVR